jgi:hypothetical protein
MPLAELLRVRRVLLWHAVIMVGLVVLVIAFGGRGVQINIDDTDMRGQHVAVLGDLFAIAMVVTTVVATWIGLALNVENATRELTWTRPISRTALALRTIAVDLGALALVFAFTVLCELLALAAVGHIPVRVDAHSAAIGFLTAGIVAMWYALLLALSAGVDGRAGAIAGLLWPAALLALTVAENTREGIVHVAALVVNLVNPLAYMNVLVHGSSGEQRTWGVWQLDPNLRGLIVWLLALALGALAVTIWRRREV